MSATLNGTIPILPSAVNVSRRASVFRGIVIPSAGSFWNTIVNVRLSSPGVYKNRDLYPQPQQVFSTMTLKALLCGLLVLSGTFVTSYALADFRYDFNPLPGKIAAAAEILIAGDNNYTLWVNGERIGAGNNWEQSQGYCVKLKRGRNLFAVEIENQPPTSPAALITAIQITYTDRSTRTIGTDGTWRVNDATPGFQFPRYDDSAWPYAVILGTANQSPWHTPYPPIPPSSLSISNSFWIWTNETDGPGGNAPVGHRAFRRTIRLPGGILARGGTIIFDTDNGYTLYINGKTIGAAHDWYHAQRWTFTFDSPTDIIVIAADAYNDGAPAGIISAIEFDVEEYYCSTYSIFVSDYSWKYSYTVPAGFEQIGYDDSSWQNAVEEGPYGMAPWGDVQRRLPGFSFLSYCLFQLFKFGLLRLLVTTVH